ncbi:TPA: tape measure protein [Klebsiella pneumoniae]|uniref:tape measure protein n=1 Tax=Klebsiella pneumoniae TaxID=573 RepID=UPI0032F62DD4|nr:tape measure protein [Klebsiella pneumoniae]HBW3134825.1 tape measure protein [Klebsiella pneumoniae]HBW3171879.1 tape measure protein [Klebsiella pneumoniae]HBW3243373.1 tape measure protein [Klebsiella pneumoniae]HBW3248839.1 tape measure protein [Klebsiella pneumoniae]
MTEKVGDIYYDVDIETAKLIAGSRKASDAIDAMGKNANVASSGIDKLDRSGQKAAGAMGVLKASLSGVASAITTAIIIDYGKAFLEVADNVTQLQSRILRLSTDLGQANSTFFALSQIASNTGASLQETQKLWEKLTSSLQSSGVTNNQILFLTDTLQKIGRVGGSSAEEMANALRQFGQSIDGGTVRAEEFNSVVENMPELARQMAAGMGLSVGQLRQAVLEGKVAAQDALNAIAKQAGYVNQEFSKLPRTMEQAENSLTVSLSLLVGKMNEATGASKTMVAIIDSISTAIDRLSGRAETAAQKIADLTTTAEMYSRRAKTWSWLGLDGWSEQNKALSALSMKAATLTGDLDAVGKASANASNSKVGFGNGPQANPKQDNLIKISERRLALAKLEGEARARLQAQYDAADAGVTDPKRIKALQDEYAETYRVTEARKESDKAGKQSASTAESIAQKLENLRQQSELAAASTQELSREQAILRAQQSLGKSATQAQVQEAGKYAAAAWDAAAAAKGVTEALNAIPEQAENKSYAETIQNLKAALNAGKIDLQEYNAATEKMEQQHQANLAKIRSQQVVNPTQQAIAEVDPVQQLANQHAQELALIQQFEQQGVIAHTQALALKKAADTQYEQQRTAAMWEVYRNQSLGNEAIAASFDALAGNASNALTGIITGSMSAQEAAQSLASTVLNSLVNAFVQMGVEWARNAIMGATTQQTAIAATTAAQVAGITTQTAASTAAAVTTTAAWTPAAIMSSIASWGGAVAIGLGAMAGVMALAGKRKNGGPVSAGSMYQVGEGGKPEIYQASTGKQYMIPGDNGKVISNKDMQSGGGVSVQVNVINQSTGATVQSADGYMQDGSAVVDLLITDMERGGPVSSQMQQTFGLNRKASGAY